MRLVWIFCLKFITKNRELQDDLLFWFRFEPNMKKKQKKQTLNETWEKNELRSEKWFNTVIHDLVKCYDFRKC